MALEPSLHLAPSGAKLAHEFPKLLPASALFDHRDDDLQQRVLRFGTTHHGIHGGQYCYDLR